MTVLRAGLVVFAAAAVASCGGDGRQAPRPERPVPAASETVPPTPSRPSPEPPATAEPEPPDPVAVPADGTIDRLPAARALVLGNTLLVIPPSFDSVRGIDMATGRTRWTTALEPAARTEASIQRLSGDRALVIADRTIRAIDVATGAVVARADHRGGESLWRTGDACALGSRCDVSLIDCESLRAIGEPLRGEVIRRYPRRPDGTLGPHTTGCERFEVQLLGRTSDVVVAVVRGARAPVLEGEQGAVVAFDARSGAVRWHNPRFACPHCASDEAGMSTDGRVCWTAHPSTGVRAFDCRTGRDLFTAPFAPGRGEELPRASTTWTSAGLFVATPGEARMLDARGGARWRVALPRGIAAIVPEAAPAGGFHQVREAWLLSPGGGERLATIPVSEGSAPIERPGGGLVIEGRGFDRTGAEVPPPAPHAIEVDRDRRVVRERARRRTIDRFEGDAWTLGEIDANGSAHNAVYIHTGSVEGEVRLYHVAR